MNDLPQDRPLQMEQGGLLRSSPLWIALLFLFLGIASWVFLIYVVKDVQWRLDFHGDPNGKVDPYHYWAIPVGAFFAWMSALVGLIGLFSSVRRQRPLWILAVCYVFPGCLLWLPGIAVTIVYLFWS